MFSAAASALGKREQETKIKLVKGYEKLNQRKWWVFEIFLSKTQNYLPRFFHSIAIVFYVETAMVPIFFVC